MNKFLFILIVLLSALFRVTNLDIVEFKIDEAANLLLSSLPLFGHSFAPGGVVSSIGILNSPLFNYILFPLISISLDPRVVVFFIAILNAFSNGFFYLVIRKYYGNTLAIVTTLLIAFSPWLILFSRKIWPPDFIFPLFAILFLSIHKILVDKKMKFWIPTVLSSLFLIQLELASAFFIMLAGLFLLFQKPKLNIKYILVGIFIGLLPLIPYFYFQLQNNCQECNMMLDAVGKKLSAKHLEVFARPFQILNQGNLRSIIGSYTITFADNFPLTYNLRVLFYLEYLLLPLGIILFWKNYKRFRFLIYVTLGLPILYFLFGIEAQMHYFIIISPLLFLFLGTFFSTLIKSNNLLIKRCSLFFFLAIILYSIIFNLSFFKFIREFGNNMDGDYGLPLNMHQKSTEDRFIRYKNDPDYQQIIISSYVPLSMMHGTSPFVRMIYPYAQIQKNLPLLEKKLKDQPQDPRVLHQLIAYYSTTIPQQSTIDTLRDKLRNTPEYAPVYSDIYSFYLQERFKKVHVSQKFKISIEYPQHWDDEAIEDKIIIKASDYNILIEGDPKNFDELLSREKFTTATYESRKVKILNTTTEKTECVTVDKKWCGTVYRPIQAYTRTILISYRYAQKGNDSISLKKYQDPALLFSLKTMDEIVGSIREL